MEFGHDFYAFINEAGYYFTIKMQNLQQKVHIAGQFFDISSNTM